MVKKFEFPDNPFHGVNGFNGVLHDFGVDLNLQKESAALGLIEHTKNHPGEAEVLIYLQSLQNLEEITYIEKNSYLYCRIILCRVCNEKSKLAFHYSI